jgi:hypothetical protein
MERVRRNPTALHPLLLTRRQVAELLSLSVMSVIRLEQQGRLQPIKLTHAQNAKTYYRAADVYAMVGERR